MKFKAIAVALATVFTMSTALTACQDKKADTGSFTGTIRIAYQNGMSYAPFYVMQKKKLIEKYLPGVTVKWSKLGSGSAVSESLAAEKADVGVMGIPPLLIAWDKGATYKMFSGLINNSLGLVTKKEEFTSLKSYKVTDKIAVPAPGSIQHILLSMAAKKQLGDAKALDGSIISMAHPDAQNALMNNIDIAGHYSSPPYIYDELSNGGKMAVDGFDTFGGDFSFLVTVATKSFMEESPAYAGAAYMALSEAINLINSRDPETIEIIAAEENLPSEKVIKYLDWEGTNYTTTPYGSMGLAEYMKEVGYISKVPAKYSDFCWDTVSSAIGQRSGKASVLETAQERN